MKRIQTPSGSQLKASPFRNPRIVDQWEPYLKEKRREIEQMSRGLEDAEAELNRRVYALFHLTPEEIALLQREVSIDAQSTGFTLTEKRSLTQTRKVCYKWLSTAAR